MYWFMIHVKPRTPENKKDCIGAFACCWINFPLEDGAELLARHYLHKHGWDPTDIKDVRSIERADYLDTDELQYFDEAVKDGASFVFDSYENE